MIIVNVKYEKCDIPCGRGTIWGNPFVIGLDGDRAEVILRHKLWLNMWKFKNQEVPITITGPKGSFTYNNRVVIENIKQLRGKKCGCFCWPQPCHLDNIKEILENLTPGG